MPRSKLRLRRLRKKSNQPSMIGQRIGSHHLQKKQLLQKKK